jgi:hypothetical protein
MRVREQRFGWDNKKWPKSQPFIRRGMPGSHKDELPSDALALFHAEAGDALGAHGYF